MLDVSRWLAEQGLGHHAELFAENGIAGDVLRDLTDIDLKELGLNLGDRKRLLNAIAALDAGPAQDRVGKDKSTAAPTVPRDAERRQLTVMFVDLVGSTELAAQLDPEDMSALIRTYQNAVAVEITRFEGHIAKYMGDGVLAYFGWPRAHEDEAERAVRAGLAITDMLAGMETRAGKALAARVGVATGLVVVGELIGEGAGQEQAVVGETPNLAARLQALAEPGRVVISQATRRLVGELFELAELGPRRLKGFAAPIRAFLVVGEGRAEGRFEALHGEQLTPLVGREHELGILLERWAWATDGDGQVVLLSGEPGIGKSRLVGALRERLIEEQYTAISHFCSPHHTNTALYPVINLLERAAGFAPGDTAEQRLGRLEALLAASSNRVKEAVPLVAALLSVATGERYPPVELSRQRQKQRTLAVLVGQLADLAARKPVLAVYEDVHWVDPTTLELLDLVVERARRLQVLVLITFRPEFNPRWAGQAHVAQLPLNRLGRRQGAAIVERLTRGKALPDEILEQIVAKTDGVPLFVEELTKTVLESNLLADAGTHHELAGPMPPFAIPATLHDSLMARLDRLAPVKQVAQIAAVIGREFDHALLAAVSPLSDDKLNEALDRLVAAELIFSRGTPPFATYTFKHALVQDAAYESLLRSRRQELHGQIARHLEALPETVAPKPEVLAHHFGVAGDMEKAFQYRFEAGRRAAERSANLEAIQHLVRARDALGKLPESSERVRRELEVLMNLGPAYSAAKGFAASEVEQTYGRVRELCWISGDNDQSRAALQGLRVLYMVRGDLVAARELGVELLTLGEREGSFSHRFEGHLAVGIVDRFGGRLASARGHLEQALALCDPVRLGALARQPTGNPAVTCLGHLSSVLFLNGFPDQSLKRSQEALEMARVSSHPFSLAQALGSTGIASFFRRPFRDDGNAAALVALADEHGFDFWRTWGLALRGWAHAEEGRIEAGVADLRHALAAAEAMGAPLVSATALTALAAILARMGELQDACSLLADQKRLAARTGIAFQDAFVRLLEGEVWLKCPDRDVSVVEACFRGALAIASQQENRILELRAATSLARLWAEQSERRRAHDLLAPIYGWFTEGFDTADLKEARTLLDELT